MTVSRCWCVMLWLVSAHGSSTSRPHIVIIMADDLGWNDVSFHGSAQIMTPNIDALAYKGVILQRHYTSPSCSPSRASLLTGLYAARTGIQRPIWAGSTTAIPLNLTLLPQHLSRLGYQSHLVGKWHLGCHRSQYLPTRRGYHSHFGFWNGFVGYYDGVHVTTSKTAGLDARRGDSEAWQEVRGHYITDILAQEAVSIVQAHPDPREPMFLHLALSAPHTGNPGTAFEVRDLETNERQHSHVSHLHRRLYAGMVRGLDDAVGTVLEALRSRDMLDNSIVLFMSDNGAPTLDPLWAFNNHGSNWPLRGMKLSSHEGGVRTAAALWSPLVEGGRVYNQLIHITDWLPTLYSAAGGRVEELGEVDGVDQWGALTSPQSQTRAPRTEMLVELDPHTGHEAIVRWPWKLIKYSSNYPTLHIHAGDSGRGPEVPRYSLEDVTTSTAGFALGLSLGESDLMALRENALIEHRCPEVVSGNVTVSQCVDHYCLFNLESDPCESVDLSDSSQSQVSALQDALELYRPAVIPSVMEVQDPRADPRLWHNYWTTWADDTPTPSSTTSIATHSCLLMMILSLTFSIVTFCRHT